jgi:hypothetical protein
MGHPLEPFCWRAALVPVSFGETASYQALKLRGSVWESVQKVFDECLAQVLPEPVRASPARIPKIV